MTPSLTRSDTSTICVVQPNRDVYSETFIRNHAERLPARVRVLYDGWFPTRCENDSRLLPTPFALMSKVEARLPPPVRTVSVVVRNRILARYLRSNRVEVVIAEYGPTGVAVMDACQHARVPFIVHFHGFDAYHYPTLDAHLREYKRMFFSAAAVVAVSRDMEQQLIALGAPAHKVHYVPYGVDPNIFNGADPSSSDPIFVAVGRFVDKKAPQLTILAFEKVLRRVPETHLIMIGAGELLESSKQLVRALRISQNVEFAGARKPAEVAATMRKARAFVQHSLRTTEGDSEGTPLAVLEAGACGLPVVSTRHGGIKDVVCEGETGFLVDEADIDSMAEYMIRLAENPGLAASLGRQFRQHVVANFSLNDSIERLWKILQCAIRTKC
jgi:colanic acid/amylovoran biosynthesis glycosyltransferase